MTKNYKLHNFIKNNNAAERFYKLVSEIYQEASPFKKINLITWLKYFA